MFLFLNSFAGVVVTFLVGRATPNPPTKVRTKAAPDEYWWLILVHVHPPEGKLISIELKPKTQRLVDEEVGSGDFQSGDELILESTAS